MERQFPPAEFTIAPRTRPAIDRGSALYTPEPVRPISTTYSAHTRNAFPDTSYVVDLFDFWHAAAVWAEDRPWWVWLPIIVSPFIAIPAIIWFVFW